jgi:hypothetical protein
MKYTFALILCVLTINVAGLMLENFGISYAVNPMTAEELRDDYNGSKVIEGMSIAEQEFYHVGRWTRAIYNLIKDLVFGFHDDLILLGLDPDLCLLIDVVWLFVIANFFYVRLSGGTDYLP